MTAGEVGRDERRLPVAAVRCTGLREDDEDPAAGEGTGDDGNCVCIGGGLRMPSAGAGVEPAGGYASGVPGVDQVEDGRDIDDNDEGVDKGV